MTDTTREALARLAELLKAATPQPWATGEGDPWAILSTDNWYCVAEANVNIPRAHDNAALIVAAVNALPALLAMAADAERYRFLANHLLAPDYGDNAGGGNGWHVRGDRIHGPVMVGPSIDAAIDALADTARQGAARGEGVGS